jgi:hypothetical protein
MLTGVSPPPLWPPKKAIDTDLVIHPHRSAQGSIGRQALSNSFSISVLRISYHTENISPELISNQNKRRFSPFAFLLFAEYPVNSIHRMFCRTHAKDLDCSSSCDISAFILFSQGSTELYIGNHFASLLPF